MSTRGPVPNHPSARPPADELSETLLGGTAYRALKFLGRGGMGEVVEAEHVQLGKPVVVKLLHRDLATQPQQVERMRIEAQSLNRLAHPNLVAVTDFGQTPEGRPYLVMERLAGRTLREELDARKFVPVLEAIDWTRQLLAGLGAAHRIGVVHRDVKLENLFVCDPAAAGGPRCVKVLDFGIAKVVQTGDERTPAPCRFPTAEGVLVGTPRSLSPEQARGGAVDARTDVYSAAIVLYTLIATRGPFQELMSLGELLEAHAIRPAPPPSAFAPQLVPPDLDAAILKALAKNPADRYPDAAAFAEALERLAAVLGRPNRWQSTEPLPTVRRNAGNAAAAKPSAPPPSPPPASSQPASSAPGSQSRPSSKFASTEPLNPEHVRNAGWVAHAPPPVQAAAIAGTSAAPISPFAATHPAVALAHPPRPRGRAVLAVAVVFTAALIGAFVTLLLKSH